MAESQKQKGWSSAELSSDGGIPEARDCTSPILPEINLKAREGSGMPHFSESQYELRAEDPLEPFIFNKIQEIPGVKDELFKAQEARKKIVPVLKSIKEATANHLNNLFSLDEDYERIKSRTSEFASRFKRNYFYRTKCQLQEIRSMDTNPLTIKKKSQLLLVIQKLTIAHLNGLSALQVLEKQITKILIIGYMQDILLSFYCNIFELMYILKPFIGKIKTGDFDEGESLILETIRIARGLNSNDLLALYLKLNRNTESSPQIVNKTGKSKGKSRLRKVERQIRNSLESFPSVVEKAMEKEPYKDKEVLFMMMMKQRPGALRRANFSFEDEPRTMVEEVAEQDTKRDSSGITIVSSLESNISSDGVGLKLEPASISHRQIRTSVNIEDSASNNDGAIPNHKHDRFSLDESWSHLIDFRNRIKKYNKSQTIYAKKSLQTMTKMAERIMEEILKESIQKIINRINVNDFSTLKTKCKDTNSLLDVLSYSNNNIPQIK